VVALIPDCDGDSVLAQVSPAGPACHSGSESCFSGQRATLRALDGLIAARARQRAPAGSYTNRLLADRNLRLKKVGEEAAEFCVACADNDRAAAVSEAADLVYHVLVALRAVGAGLDDLTAELAGRRPSADG
jgi:phosphoribosyl-ATP pyrophosphohydrolase/phosphoribosyl-AMP cyclohydrolase